MTVIYKDDQCYVDMRRVVAIYKAQHFTNVRNADGTLGKGEFRDCRIVLHEKGGHISVGYPSPEERDAAFNRMCMRKEQAL